MKYYVGLIWRGEGAGYGVTVPDLPGFTAHVEEDDLGAAVDTAQRVLTDHIAAIVDSGRPLPEPRAPVELEKDAEAHAEMNEAEAFVMLRAILPAGRTMRINMTLDESTLALIDDEAAKRGLSRSAFIAEASRRFANDNASNRAVADSAVMAPAVNAGGGTLFERMSNIAREASAAGQLEVGYRLANDGRFVTAGGGRIASGETGKKKA